MQAIKQHNLDIKKVMSEINDGKLMNRHFSPQWIWLLHLRRFFNGRVILRDFKNIRDYSNVRTKKEDTKITVDVPVEFISADSHLIKHFDNPVSLDAIIKECRNALSAS